MHNLPFTGIDLEKRLDGALTYVTHIVQGERFNPETGAIESTTANYFRSSKFATLGKFNLKLRFATLSSPGTLTAHGWDSKGNYTGSVSQTIASGLSTFTWSLVPSDGDAYYAIDFSGNDNDASSIIADITYDYADQDDVPTKVSDLENDSGFITPRPIVDITEEVWINAGGCSLDPNVYYRVTTAYAIDIIDIMLNASDTSVYNEYIIEFTTPATGTSLILSDTVKWLNGEVPTLEGGKTYILSIHNNLAICALFE